MSETLFEQVKRKLNITWEDDETNANVERIINSAIPTLIYKLGITDKDFDFSVAGQENTLFLAYCLYEYNHCVNEFDDNYHNDIAQVQDKHAVAYHLATTESEGTESE